MNYVGQIAETVLGTVKELYRGLNPATLTGCIDVIVVRQPDGSLLCSPFHVRFGKLRVLHSSEKVVDIEINGEPVNLQMKLGENGEAFFVEESEEQKESIPYSLCTSPIPSEKSAESKDRTSSLYGNPEGLGSDTALRKKRWCKKKPKKRESTTDSTSEEEGTESERTLEEKRKLLASNLAQCLFPSLSPNCSSAPKSDSELEMRNPEPSFGSESHLRWSWGRLPEVRVVRDEFSEARKSTTSLISTTTGLPAASPIAVPVSESTHFVAISAHSESDLGMVDSDDASGSPVTADIRVTPVSSTGDGLPGDEDKAVFLKILSGSLQGSMKRNPHLGPTDIYLEDLSNLDAEELALYFPKSDAELSGQAQNDPGSFSCAHVLGGATVDDLLEPTTNSSMPHVLLSLCGGLGDDGELSHAEKFMKHIVSYQEFAENPAILEDQNLVVKFQNKYYSWAVAAPMLLSLQAFQKNLPKSTIDRLMKEKMPKKGGRWWFSWRRRELPNEEVHMDYVSIKISDALTQKFLPIYKKSLRLSSEQIKSLNLRDGPNEIVFSVTTQYQGTCRCEATIYLWDWYDKVVISDIDGTITRSDALGHILPHLGKDWTHQGIVRLFHKIHLNGYKFLYCSARAIGMAHITKGYLDCVNDQGWVLPKGPILLAPSSLFSAFHREVIEKKPEVFKIACLTDIRNLFGADRQPFHAAFGNRANDIYAYKKVELPESRIFTVNPKGELIQEVIKVQKSTYDRLGDMVEFLFPPVGEDVSVSLVCPEFSQFSYWRTPLPSVDFEDFV
uniref:phosphatidate phosphatase n=1 Tax=Varanus komodoensis TaxID=61221 RepID=A0A8D2L8A1_VARKO